MAKRMIIPAVIGLFLVMSACGGADFAGTERGDGGAYAAEFTELNSERTHELDLEEGDTLSVEITRVAGEIGLTINGAEGYEAYTGNKLPTGTFTVGIPKAGRYTVTVKGKNAAGSVCVSALSA